MKRAAVLLALLLAGCGGAEREATTVAGPGLTVTVRPEGPDGPTKTRSVTCPGSTGCDAPLEPTPPTTACTEIYGGPATATVSGQLEGRPVEAEFSLANGCEIDRWRKASALLGEPPEYAPDIP